MDEFKRGDRVVFGRRHGEQTLGEVVKVNAKTVKVRQLEERGTQRTRPVGTLWTVAKALVRHADAAAQPAAPVAPPALGRWQPEGFPKRACLVNVITGERTYGPLCKDQDEYEFECEMLFERLANAC